MSRARRNVLLIPAFAVVVGVALWLAAHRAQPEIRGRVTLKGTPRPEIRIALDPHSAKLRPNGLTTRHYVVSSNGGLANVFVFIKSGVSNYAAPSTNEPVLMDYRGAQIEPYVIAVQRNQAVRFRNLDPILHNVHIMPKAPGNRDINFAMATPTAMIPEPWYRALYRRFVLRRPPPSMGLDKAFAAAEPLIRVKCDVHPWEFGYICVSDHPFFAVTDADGNFAFPTGLPPGRYVIEARHLKAGAVTQEVMIARGERKQLQFTLEVPADPSR